MVKPGKFGHLYLVYHFTVPLTLQVFLSVVGSLHFFSMECQKLPASNRSACIDQAGLLFSSLPNFFPLKYYFHDVALYFLQITFCGLLSVALVFPFDPQIFCWLIKSWLSLMFLTVFLILVILPFEELWSFPNLLLFHWFLLWYCCPYLLIFGLEHQICLRVFLAFMRLICLCYPPGSVIFIFFNSFLMSCICWRHFLFAPSGTYFTFLVYLVSHLYFDSFAILTRLFAAIYNSGIWFVML